MSPRLIKFKAGNSESMHKILPIDLYFNKRCTTYPSKELSKSEMDNLRIELFSNAFPIQTNKSLCHPALYFDLKDSSQEILISITDNYIPYVKQNKIIPIRSEIKRFESPNSVRLEDGSLIDQLDAIIYCTGYTSSYDDFFNKSTLKNFNYDPAAHYKYALILYKNTFHPYVENLALIGQQDGLYFNGCELQAKWASKVFSGKLNLPSREKMSQFIDKEIQKRNKKRRSQYPYGSHVSLSDSIANEMDLLPDFDDMRIKNPKHFDMLWNKAMISAHFAFKDNRNSALDMINEINVMDERTYEFQNDTPTNKEIATQFSKHYKLPSHMVLE